MLVIIFWNPKVSKVWPLQYKLLRWRCHAVTHFTVFNRLNGKVFVAVSSVDRNPKFARFKSKLLRRTIQWWFCTVHWRQLTLETVDEINPQWSMTTLFRDYSRLEYLNYSVMFIMLYEVVLLKEKWFLKILGCDIQRREFFSDICSGFQDYKKLHSDKRFKFVIIIVFFN